MAPSASVTFTSVPTSITKGSTGTFNTTSTASLANATLYWKIVNGTTTDSNFSAVTGSYTATGGAGSFSIVTLTDGIYQADLTFTVRVYQDSGYTNLRATSASVNLASPSPHRYWVGGTGTWDPASTANWSTTSGGSPGAAAPLATGNAIFDANSGGGTVTVLDGPGGSGFPPECANLTCTGFTGTLEYPGGASLNVNGNVTLSSGGDYTNFAFYAISPTVCTLTSVGKRIYGLSVELGATVTLADDLDITNFDFGIGTFTTNNFNVVADSFNILGTLNMGSSTFTVNSSFGWYADPGSTINAGTSTIITNASSAFDGGGKTYYNLNIGWTNLDIYGNNTFNTISNSVQPTTIRFESGSTQTVTNFTVSGTSGNLVILDRNGATGWTLSKASGTVSINFVLLRSSNATGGAAWYAGANSTNSNSGPRNSGWIFTAPPVPSATNSNFLQFF